MADPRLGHILGLTGHPVERHAIQASGTSRSKRKGELFVFSFFFFRFFFSFFLAYDAGPRDSKLAGFPIRSSKRGWVVQYAKEAV